MTPSRYVMKTDPSYVVEAVQLHESDTNWAEVADWCGGDVHMDGSPATGIFSVLVVGNDSGVHGDWIVKQSGGWFVWDADGFAHVFHLVTEAAR
ncbi:hypothetical protein ABT369_39330 [Dactylosporangium sp. NPDC000244]|uniref:hypothetical protein n=1 Tax=Dactylosporangium sp. NPDC000244 TaxID=3154365 RepID=UPI00332E707E